MPEKSQEWVMVLKEMLRNPALKNQFKYTPPSVGGFDSEDDEGKSGIFNYMCTVAANVESGNQVFFFCSLIIIFMLTICQKASAWPVYHKLGNIAKWRDRQVEIEDTPP